MSSSRRSRSNLHVKFADNIHLDDDQWRLDQHQGDVDNMNELPVARIQPEQERHIRENSLTDSGIGRKRRGRPAKHDQLNTIDADWHVEERNNYHDLPPADVTLRSEGNPSVYEFNESSKPKSLNSTETNHSRRSSKTPIKIRRDEKHPCSYCNYCTNKKYLLQRHLKSHSTERPHKCNYCSNTFKTTAQLQNHVNTHLGIKPFQCKFCEYKFTTSGELIRHVRYKHTMEKPHKCEVCGYATVELSKLRRHIRTHTGEKPYACPHCSYCSPDTFKLKRHLRVHTGERPYQCTICKFRFTQSNSLKAHMLTHQTNVQKFHCTYCPAVLTRKADLKQHMIKKHAKDENFLTCLQCDQEFAHPRDLNEHKNLHHTNSQMNTSHVQLNSSVDTSEISSQHRDNQSYQCYECGLIYGTHRDLRQHVRKVHGREIDADRPAGGLPVRTRPYSFTTTMKEEEEIIENEANSKAGQQMAIIQIRNQHNDSQKSSLIVRIEQDADDDLETADGFFSNKLTPHSQRNERIEDYMENDGQEYEIGDAFVELIDDNPGLVDEDETNLIFKSRSTTTHKSN